MTTTFDQRERAFEQKFARDEDLRFKVHVRRSRKLGLWAAEQLQLKGDAAEKYAATLATADIAKFHDDELVSKIAADFAAKGVSIGPDEIRRQMEQMLVLAKRQVAAG
jgi:hypothetical protein